MEQSPEFVERSPENLLKALEDYLKGSPMMEKYMRDHNMISAEDLCWATGTSTDSVCEICEHRFECSGYEECD